MVWELGGPPGEYPLEETGTFFLGAPLVREATLYVLGESNAIGAAPSARRRAW